LEIGAGGTHTALMMAAALPDAYGILFPRRKITSLTRGIHEKTGPNIAFLQTLSYDERTEI